MRLPPAREHGPLPGLLRARRSTKAFRTDALSVDDVADLLWSAAGATQRGRTVPSARAGHPLTTTLVAGAVNGLDAGAFRYDVADHAVELVRAGDHREALAAATLDAAWLVDSPVVLVLSADLDAADARFADQGAGRGRQFVFGEAGAVAQTVHVWAAAADLGTVFIGGLRTTASDLVPSGHRVVGLMPVGCGQQSSPASTGSGRLRRK